MCSAPKERVAIVAKQMASMAKSARVLKVIHREFSSAHFFLIVDLRERGTLLQHKNGSKKSQAKKLKNSSTFHNIFVVY